MTAMLFAFLMLFSIPPMPEPEPVITPVPVVTPEPVFDFPDKPPVHVFIPSVKKERAWPSEGCKILPQGSATDEVCVPIPSPWEGPSSSIQCNGDFYNCDSFATWDDAQLAFQFCMIQGLGDPHGLDRDADNFACEALENPWS